MVCYPRKLRIVGGAFAAALLAVAVLGWFALPQHLRDQFTVFQILTLLVFLAAIIAVIAMVALSVVRADAEVVTVRNGIRTHRLAWRQVHAVIYRQGDPWPTLLVGDPDDPHRQLVLGIQRTDGDRSVRAVTALRELHARAQSPS
ncbi:PH domain-containing protein [Microlunatus elymi]|uniref:PH domain-containing protein n=1 Tax=Microlunatus elymi TaxID=2596828 RepID=A0A516Q1N8_9ACTN|nr:PH domain-containing protein [Microlunatus elymi]QDP97334.1 PH domain-containing protein [Microlunatus elymi]